MLSLMIFINLTVLGLISSTSTVKRVHLCGKVPDEVKVLFFQSDFKQRQQHCNNFFIYSVFLKPGFVFWDSIESGITVVMSVNICSIK